MSIEITPLRPASRVPLLDRVPALIAVVAGPVLARLKPRLLRRVLEAARRGARPASETDARRAMDAVLTVSVRLRGEWCLQRSIAVALFCRLKGSWPEWCTGVRTEPFQAHAWVAVAGRPVGENPHTLPHFSIVWTVPPLGQHSTTEVQT
jgi:hypothetical protein